MQMYKWIYSPTLLKVQGVDSYHHTLIMYDFIAMNRSWIFFLFDSSVQSLWHQKCNQALIRFGETTEPFILTKDMQKAYRWPASATFPGAFEVNLLTTGIPEGVSIQIPQTCLILAAVWATNPHANG